MKTIISKIMMLVAAVAMLSSCDNDGNTVYLNGFESSSLIASTSEVTLSVSNSNSIVLSLAWQNPTLLSSDENNPAPSNLLSTTIQVSASADFGTLSESTATSLSKAYTGTELNTLAKNLGIEADHTAPLYFRIKSSEGDNMEPAYSNVCTVNVTPYTVDMTRLSVLNSAKSDTIAYLFSPEQNGVYEGFMYASSWLNCWFYENDGTTWGNYGVDGYPFVLSNASDAWNCWFADGTGHWYVTVDTNEEQWSAALIQSMRLNGTDMTFDTTTKTWRLTITTSSANEAISFEADAKEYNATTKTDADAALDRSFHFALSNGAMTLADASTTATIATAGTYTIVVTLGSNAQFSYEVIEGEVNPDVPEVSLPADLYMVSPDGTEEKATLTGDGNGIYTCTYSPWAWENIKFVDRENNIWYGSDPSDLYTLSSDDGCWAIWFEDDVDGATPCTITVDLKAKKWSYTKQ